jgi:hypothetical protein
MRFILWASGGTVNIAVLALNLPDTFASLHLCFATKGGKATGGEIDRLEISVPLAMKVTIG